MSRFDLLSLAADAVRQRAESYGSPEDNASRIAELWSAYYGAKFSPHDVAAMMALVKIARLRNDPGHLDSWVDLAGYAAYGAEVVGF